MLEFDIQCYTLGSLTTGGVVVFFFFLFFYRCGHCKNLAPVSRFVVFPLDCFTFYL